MPGIAWHGLWITSYDEEKLKNHVCKHTRHKYFVLDTDGAGAYAGSELMARLGFMLPDCDVRIIEHCIGEPGVGKIYLRRRIWNR
jgi:hypothetical protein